MGGIQSHTRKNKYKENLQVLQELEQFIFDLNEENLEQTVETLLNSFSVEYSYSFFYIICRIIYSYFISKGDEKLCLEFLQKIEIKSNNNVIDMFTQFLLNINSQESYYLVEKMIENELIEEKIFKSKMIPYFAHYAHITKKQITCLISDISPRLMEQLQENYDELSKDNWELHKHLIKEGVNPNKLAKIIRNDEIEKLQEISSQNDFKFNQYIIPSLYERCSFINKENVTLIDYAAFFGSVKCFKYLLINGAKVNNTGKYAIAGGNEEIVHLCEQNHSSFEGAYKTAIEFHRNDVFKYVYENKFEEIYRLDLSGRMCITYYNFEIFEYLIKEGMTIDNFIVIEAARMGNIYLIKHFLEDNYQVPSYFLVFATESGNIELVNYILEQKGIDVNGRFDGRTPLTIASEHGYIKIVKLLLEQKGIDINIRDNWYRSSAIINATLNGHVEMVKLLLDQNGIDINMNNNKTKTSLIIASSKGYTEIVKLLLEKRGIDINYKTFHKEKTALMIASKKGYTKIVKLLLKQEEIIVNDKDYNGWTALIYASKNNRKDIVKLLLNQKGIDINIINKKGETALTLASNFDHTEIVHLLNHSLE